MLIRFLRRSNVLSVHYQQKTDNKQYDTQHHFCDGGKHSLRPQTLSKRQNKGNHAEQKRDGRKDDGENCTLHSKIDPTFYMIGNGVAHDVAACNKGYSKPQARQNHKHRANKIDNE